MAPGLDVKHSRFLWTEQGGSAPSVVISEPVRASPDCWYYCVSSLQCPLYPFHTSAHVGPISPCAGDVKLQEAPHETQTSLYTAASEQQRSLEKLCTLPFWLTSSYVVTTNLQWALGSARSPTWPPCCFRFLWEENFTPSPSSGSLRLPFPFQILSRWPPVSYQDIRRPKWVPGQVSFLPHTLRCLHLYWWFPFHPIGEGEIQLWGWPNVDSWPGQVRSTAFF